MSSEYSTTALNGDMVVQDIVRKIVDENNIGTIVETGTHIGHSTYFFGGLGKNVITTEINEGWLNQAKKHLAGFTNVQFFLGDSATLMSEELKKLNDEKVFFFLDAHFNNDLALDRELKAIAESKVVPYIMIHDFKVPNRSDLGYDGWDGKEYSLENIKHMIDEIYPKGYSYYYNEESALNQRGCIVISPAVPKKKIVYTAMFGDYDDIRNPIVEIPGWDMRFYTDSEKIISNRWDVVHAPRIKGFDSVQMSRHFKILPHLHLKEYDISLWVDSSIVIQKSIDEFVNFITDDAKMGIYQHVCSWKTEFDIMGEYYSKNTELLNSQMLDYKNDGFDIDSTIMSGNVILREHFDKKVMVAMQLWWDQFNKYYIKRDQISLAYSIWKSGLNVNFFPELYPRGDRNKYFRSMSHKKTCRLK